MSELYLNGVKMDLVPGEVVATTVQANDLAQPDKVQSSFTNTFQVVATARVLESLGYPNNVSSRSLTPYTALDAQVIADGRELLPSGLGEVSDYRDNKLEVAVISGNVSFFDTLADKSIKDLDLSEFDHLWRYEDIIQHLTSTENFIYDLLDRGKDLDFRGVDCYDLLPSVFGKLIFDRIFAEAGFTYTGLNTPLLNKLLLPATGPLEYSQEFIDAHSTNAGTTAGARTKIEEFTETVYFNSVTAFDYSDGAALNFDPATGVYTAKEAVYVTGETRLAATIGAQLGTVSLSVGIYHNGAKIAEDKQEITGNGSYQEQGLQNVYQASLADFLLQPGETLKVVVDFKHSSIVASPYCQILYSTDYPLADVYNKGKDYFKITVQKRFPRGGTVRIKQVLPDIKQKDFVKFVLQLHNGLQQTDNYSHIIRLNEFRELETNTGRALDWSDKYVKEQNIAYKFGDFGQKNYIRYKEDETVNGKPPIVLPAFGDGMIPCANQNLPAEVTIIDWPFAASLPSVAHPQLTSIPMWKPVKNSNPTAYDDQKLQPRVLLQSDEKVSYVLSFAVESGFIEAGKGYRVQGYTRVLYDGTYFTDGQTFTGRPGKPNADAEGTGQVIDTSYDLAVTAPLSYFDRANDPASLHGQKLVSKYYQALESILNQTKYLKAQFRLTPGDVAGYDATVPVWLNKYRQYFYLNKIEEYQAGNICTVELIRL